MEAAGLTECPQSQEGQQHENPARWIHNQDSDLLFAL